MKKKTRLGWEQRVEDEYYQDGVQVTEDIKLFLTQYIKYSNLSDLFESTNYEYIRRVRREVEMEYEDLVVSKSEYNH